MYATAAQRSLGIGSKDGRFQHLSPKNRILSVQNCAAQLNLPQFTTAGSSTPTITQYIINN
jgi:hypothetical protein